MVRSWAYILMIAATLAGVVALVWPSPEVQTIEEIVMPARTAPTRAEPAPKPAKQAAKAPQKREPAAPPVPAAVKNMPAPNTTTKRQFAQPENGMQTSPFNRPEVKGAVPPTPPDATKPPARPGMPFRPGETPRREPPAR